MSAIFSSSNFTRSVSLLDYNSPYTVMGWFYILGSPNNQNLFVLSDGDNSDNPPNYDTWQVNSNGYRVEISNNRVKAGLSAGSFTGVNQWFHFAGVRSSATDTEAYEYGLPLRSIATLSTVGRAPVARQNVGSFSTFYSDFLNGYAAHIFEYSAALSQAEIQNQMFKAQPQRTANLHAWTPCKNGERAIDFSGNGRNWTEINSMSDGIIEPPLIYAPPPMVLLKPPPIVVYFNSPRMLLAC